MSKLKKLANFVLSFKDLIYQQFGGPSLRGKKRQTLRNANYQLYKSGENKLYEEFDIVNIIKKLRKSEFLSSTFLTQNHELLMNYQKDYILDNIQNDMKSERIGSISASNKYNHALSGDTLNMRKKWLRSVFSDEDFISNDKATSKLLKNICEDYCPAENINFNHAVSGDFESR